MIPFDCFTNPMRENVKVSCSEIKNKAPLFCLNDSGWQKIAMCVWNLYKVSLFFFFSWVTTDRSGLWEKRSSFLNTSLPCVFPVPKLNSWIKEMITFLVIQLNYWTVNVAAAKKQTVKVICNSCNANIFSLTLSSRRRLPHLNIRF